MHENSRSRKSEHFRKDKLTYPSRNLNSALSPTAGKPKLRHLREDSFVNNRTHLFFVVFYVPRKYDIMFEKVADQEPHYCTAIKHTSSK